jgi:branched-chain amino acid transport system permease protein
MRPAKLDFAAALKDAALAALTAFGLFSLMLGLRTDPGITGRLTVFPRPELLATSVAAVFAGRFVIALIAQSRIAGDLTRLFQAVAPKLEYFRRFAIPIVAVITPLLFYFSRDYPLNIAVLVLALTWLRLGLKPALLVFALLLPVLFYSNRYILDLGILVLTYVMLGWGLNIVVGLAGLLDLGYVAFYAVGAYSYALLAHFGACCSVFRYCDCAAITSRS